MSNIWNDGDPIADTAAPDGPIETRWERRQFAAKLVNPANRRKLTVIVVGTGLAGGSAAATLAEAGYHVKSYCYQDSPRRAHSIAAQGGINAAKNYRNDGDSIYRLFYDTVKGGDFRARESNVYRLAQVVGEHHRPVRGPGRPVRPRVRRPARQPLVRRHPGVAHLLRPRPDRPAAAARRLPGDGAADRARQHRDERPARDARADRRRRQGPRHRRPRHGHRRDHHRDGRRGRARLRRLRQRLLPVHQRQGLQRHRVVAGAPQGRAVREPLLHADPPDLHPRVGHAPVEAHADERVAAQRRPGLGAAAPAATRARRATSPRTSATTTSSGSTRRSATWSPATSPPARPRTSATRAAASAPAGSASTSTSRTRSTGWARRRSRPSTATCSRCTSGSPARTRTQVPMRIYPAVHYTMGGLWVDYDLQSTIPGLFVVGEANFSDHGANRLGASALMQGLADGYFVLPNTISNYLAAGPFAQGRPRSRGGGRGARRKSRTGIEKLPGDRRRPHRRLLPPRARPHHVGVLRHGAHRGGPDQGDRPDPRPARRVLAAGQGARHRRAAQPEPGEGRPGRRLLRARPS